MVNKKGGFDFNDIASVISENEKKNKTTIQKSIKNSLPVIENLEKKGINYLAIEENPNIPSEATNIPIAPGEQEEAKNTPEQNYQKRRGRPKGSKNRIDSSNYSEQKLSSIFQKKEQKKQIPLYLEESKVTKIDSLCDKYNVSRNELVRFFVTYGLENLSDD